MHSTFYEIFPYYEIWWGKINEFFGNRFRCSYVSAMKLNSNLELNYNIEGFEIIER